MGRLDQVKRGMPTRGRAIVCHGPIGIGKTEWAAAGLTLEEGVFLHHVKEQGINDLKKSEDVPADTPTLQFDSWMDLLAILNEIAGDDIRDDMNFVAIDSLTWVEQICYEHVCSTDFGNNWSTKGFYDHWAGPRMAANRYWPAMIEVMEEIVQQGKTVVCIAHTKSKEVNNPGGTNYDQWVPEMDRDSFKLFTIWAQHVLFFNYRIEVDKPNPRSKGTVSSYSREISTVGDPTFIAKSKGLPDEISMGRSGKEGWQHFLDAEEQGNKPKPKKQISLKRKAVPKKT